MDEMIPATKLDIRNGVNRDASGRVEVYMGTVSRRRFWSLEQKLAIVAESEKADNLSELARRHDIRTSQLYTWRRELRYALQTTRPDRSSVHEPMFVPVIEAGAEMARKSTGGIAIEVEMSAGVVRVSQNVDIALIQGVIDALTAVR